MISFNVLTCSWASDNASPMPMTWGQASFGTLHRCGILGRHYEHWSSDPDLRVLVWTVNVPCIINGTEYTVDDRIEWEK